MTLAELWTYIRDGGTLAVLVLVIVSGARGYWIFGREAEDLRARIRDLEKRLDRAERLALSGTTLARRATSLVERGEPDHEDADDA